MMLSGFGPHNGRYRTRFLLNSKTGLSRAVPYGVFSRNSLDNEPEKLVSLD